MLYRNYILVVVLLVSSVYAAQEQSISPLVAKELLQEAGLGQVWQTKLAVKEGEQIEKLYLLGDRVYGLTTENYLFCINRDNGSLVFGMQLAPEGFPVLEPRSYDNQLLVVAGDRLLQIDAAGGNITYTQKFNRLVVCPAVRNAATLYAVEVDRRVHAITMSDGLPLFEAAADNDSMPTSVLAAGGYVAFATDKGNVVCISAAGPQLLWQYNTEDKITAAMVKDGNDLYAASWDTRIYKFKAATGKLLWKFQLGGIPKASPRVTPDIVYQPVADRGITAINKDSGLPLWTAEDGIDLLAQANGKAYIMTNNRTVAVVDKSTYKRLFTVNFAQAALYAANTVDGKIYIADKSGRLACIEAKQ